MRAEYFSSISKRCGSHRIDGFTLIEMMIALTLIGIILALSVPTLAEFQQRSIVRGAADQLVSFWALARFESVKRNAMVKVSFVRSGNDVCLGASIANTASDDATCDCFTPNACSVAQYPVDQSEWRGAQWIAAPSLGDSGSGVAVIDPKRGYLTEPTDDGVIEVRSPAENHHYRLRFYVTNLGRAGICEPIAAPMKLPDYATRSCGS